jgi:hypothetical protein
VQNGTVVLNKVAKVVESDIPVTSVRLTPVPVNLTLTIRGYYFDTQSRAWCTSSIAFLTRQHRSLKLIFLGSNKLSSLEVVRILGFHIVKLHSAMVNFIPIEQNIALCKYHLPRRCTGISYETANH